MDNETTVGLSKTSWKAFFDFDGDDIKNIDVNKPILINKVSYSNAEKNYDSSFNNYKAKISYVGAKGYELSLSSGDMKRRFQAYFMKIQFQ